MAALAAWADIPGIFSMYPMPEQLAAERMSTRLIKRAFEGTSTRGKTLIMIKYAESLHWHQLFFFSGPKRVYFHEPYGSAVGGRGVIAKAFEASVGPSLDWKLLSARVVLQSCSWECGTPEQGTAMVLQLAAHRLMHASRRCMGGFCFRGCRRLHADGSL